MDITPLLTESRQVIQGYGAGGFKIAGQEYAGSVLVFPDETHQWHIKSFAELGPEDFQIVMSRAAEINLLLIGCGKNQEFFPPALRKALSQHGIVVDSMDTGAACRTFNVLLSEERRVAAALIA